MNTYLGNLSALASQESDQLTFLTQPSKRSQ